MTGQPRLSIIPGWVATDPRLKGKDLAVLCVLGRNANTKSGWTRRSQVVMADELSCSRSTVQAALNRLIEIGVVERHVQESASGRDSAHWYRVIYDREPPQGYAFDAWDDGEIEENIPADMTESVTPPAGIPAPPAGPEQAPPAGPGSAPINVSTLTPPAERKERENAGEHENEEDAKQLMKRVKALEIGRNGNPWPGTLGSSTDWAVRQFTKLTPDLRHLAELRRDDYLAVCKAQGVKPVPLGVYCRDLKFMDVTSQAAKAASAKIDRVAVKPFGPVWAGKRALALGRGPIKIELSGNLREIEEQKFATLKRSNEGLARRLMAAKGIEISPEGWLLFPDEFEKQEYQRRQRDSGYPEVTHLHKLANDHAHEMTDARYGALAELCEAVPVGSDMYEAWRAYHEQRMWMTWPDPGNMRVVYFPKGGPERFGDFMRAALAAIEGGQEGNEGHERDAAE